MNMKRTTRQQNFSFVHHKDLVLGFVFSYNIVYQFYDLTGSKEWTVTFRLQLFVKNLIDRQTHL